MTAEGLTSIIIFLADLMILMVVVYLVTLLLGKRRSLKLALFTSIVGLIIYWIANSIWANSLVSALLGGISWLVTLKTIYRMSWIRALIVAVGILVITYLMATELRRMLGF